MIRFLEILCEAIIWAMIFGILLLLFGGCADWTASQISTGATAGRTFDDGRVFSTGRTVWTINTNVVWTPTRGK